MIDHILQVKESYRLTTINDAKEGKINVFPGNNRLSSNQLSVLKNHPLGLKILNVAYTIIDKPKGGDFEDIRSIKDSALAVQIAKYELNFDRLIRWRDSGEDRPEVLREIHNQINFLTAYNLRHKDHAEVAQAYLMSFQNWQRSQTQKNKTLEVSQTW